MGEENWIFCRDNGWQHLYYEFSLTFESMKQSAESMVRFIETQILWLIWEAYPHPGLDLSLLQIYLETVTENRKF